MHKRSFYSLLITQTIANAADIMYIMALTVLVLHETSSLLSAVLIPLIRMGAQMISSFLAPLLLVRFQLPFLLFVSQGAQLLLYAALAAYLHYTPQHPLLALVLAIVLAMSFLDGWTTPARNALVPRIASGSHLLKANTIMTLSDRIVQFAGWGLSGVIVSFLGSQLTLLIAAVLYTASFAFTSLVYDPLEPQGHYLLRPRTSVTGARSGDAPAAAGIQEGLQQPAAAEAQEVSSPIRAAAGGASPLPAESADLQEALAAMGAASEGKDAASEPSDSPPKLSLLRDGFRTIAVSARLRTLAFIDIVDTLGASVWVGAFTLALVQDVLKQGEEWWGYINAAYFAGSILGSMAVLAWVKKLQKRLFASMLAGMAGYGALTAAYALNHWPAAALVLVIVMGPVAELSIIPRQTLIQQSTQASALPQVLSAQNTIINFFSMVSLLLLGWIADRFGIQSVYLISAALTFCAIAVGIAARKAFASR
ncbi:MFS transporter [Paenibacillus protaetiae]|uniref:MFS transporter n=1 Tax=Paenibacillus protaetiae TaxID=2509456 RepID=A0A4P6F2S7_9BACL|nr:MFS transporter [Paenibacillus protaetiae]QAY67397.1 MFS transporter [Paenibacillus protaetiae]